MTDTGNIVDNSQEEINDEGGSGNEDGANVERDEGRREAERNTRNATEKQAKESELKQMIRSRSALLGQMTAKRNCLMRLMEGGDSAKVKIIFERYQEAAEKFLACHGDIQQQLAAKDKANDQAYCDAKVDAFEDFSAEVTGWLTSMDDMEAEGLNEPSTPNRFSRIDARAPPFTPRQESTMLNASDRANTFEISNLTQATERALTAISDTQRDLTRQMRMPRSEPDIFDGDATKFREFLIDFEEYVCKWTQTDRERLTQLRNYTTGKPNDLVRGCIHLPPTAGYAEAMRLLQSRYGAPYDTSRAYVKKLKDWPRLSMKAPEEIDRFAILLRDSYNALTGLGRLTELEHPTTMKEIVNKLPDCLRYKWITMDTGIFTATGNPGTYYDLVTFVETQAKVVSNPRYGSTQKSEENTGSSNRYRRQKNHTITSHLIQSQFIRLQQQMKGRLDTAATVKKFIKSRTV